MNTKIGPVGRASIVVAEADLATALVQSERDSFPPVFATARMVGLMELAASRVSHADLAPGELSVGVTVDVQHTAATPMDVVVEAQATLVGKEGKLFVFEVVARDAGGEIGRGVHRRAIVASNRLVEGAGKRVHA